jgi:hypothetical protein
MDELSIINALGMLRQCSLFADQERCPIMEAALAEVPRRFFLLFARSIPKSRPFAGRGIPKPRAVASMKNVSLLYRDTIKCQKP